MMMMMMMKFCLTIPCQYVSACCSLGCLRTHL